LTGVATQVRAQAAVVPADTARDQFTILISADGKLHLYTRHTGIDAAIGLTIDPSYEPPSGGERSDARTAGPLAAAIGVEPRFARAFGAAAESLVTYKHGPARGDSVALSLTGIGGSLTLVRLPEAKRKPRFRIRVGTEHVTQAVVLGEPEATELYLTLRDVGERFDMGIPVDYSRVYERQMQVDKPVVPAPGGCSPGYPEKLRKAGQGGTVIAEFVVDGLGMAVPGTFRALRSTHKDFEAEVRAALPCFRYLPAELRGRPVRFRLSQPFTFDVVDD
jgi:hypothetical protein